MPEIAEIHSFASSINEWASNVAITSIHRGRTAKGPDFSIGLPLARWSIFASARGKELAIDISPATSDTKADRVTVTFTHGLVGQWQRHPRSAIPVFCQVAFLTATDEAICFIDAMRMGNWRVGGFDSKRGPDPINDHEAFVKRIKSSLSKPAFTKPICEVMLNQDFFNGIGNYLRAEILYRARVMPFESARAVLSDAARAERLLSLCHTIPCEVINLKLNKYGTAVEKQRFLQWLQCYEKGTFSTDSAGRKIYFFDKQNELPIDSTPAVPTPSAAVPSHQTTAPAAPTKSAAAQSRNTTPAAGAAADSHLKAAAMLHRPRESPPPQKDLTRMLMIISVLFKTDRISAAQRATLKDQALLGNDVAFSILEAFMADENKDWDELTDSFSRFCTISLTA